MLDYLNSEVISKTIISYLSASISNLNLVGESPWILNGIFFYPQERFKPAVIKEQSSDDSDVFLTLTSDTLKTAIIGEQTIKQLTDSGEIDIEGNIEDFIEVFEMFDPSLS